MMSRPHPCRRPSRSSTRWLLAAVAATGCTAPDNVLSLEQRQDLQHRAALELRSAAQDPNAGVRARAVEALADCAPDIGGPIFQELLDDPHPGVQFAALMAIGQTRYAPALPRARALADHSDPNVRLGALFALHCLGDRRRTTELADYLQHHASAAVRGNAAIVLGRIRETGAIPLLESALRDREESVRLQVLEALTLLGDKKAVRELGLIGMSGAGQKIVFALMALAEARRPEARELFEYQFQFASHDEVRLAAAFGLGRLGRRSGLAFAVSRFENYRPADGGADSPADRYARVKTLAARAIEAAGDPLVLGVFHTCLAREQNPTVRVAAARAVLAIVRREPPAPQPGSPTAAARHSHPLGSPRPAFPDLALVPTTFPPRHRLPSATAELTPFL